MNQHGKRPQQVAASGNHKEFKFNEFHEELLRKCLSEAGVSDYGPIRRLEAHAARFREIKVDRTALAIERLDIANEILACSGKLNEILEPVDPMSVVLSL